MMQLLSDYDLTTHNLGQHHVSYEDYDHTCPKIPVNGKPNIYAIACLARTAPGAPCYTKGCRMGNALRRKHGLAPIPEPVVIPYNEMKKARRREINARREELRLAWREANRCPCGAPSMEKRWLNGRKPICAKCSKQLRDRVKK